MQVFATAESLKHLCSSSSVFMDGTFKVVPTIFSQLYILHSKVLGQVRNHSHSDLNNMQIQHDVYVQLFFLIAGFPIAFLLSAF
jgi:hypothetical protein